MPRPCVSSIQAFDVLSMQSQSHPQLLGLALGLISQLKWRGSVMFSQYPWEECMLWLLSMMSDAWHLINRTLGKSVFVQECISCSSES